MPSIHPQVSSPADAADAELILDWLVSNPARNAKAVSESLRAWDRRGCHLLAQSIKGSRHAAGGNTLASTLRQIANTAIILEHRLATRTTA